MSDIVKKVVLVKIWHGTTDRGQPPMGLLFIGNALKKAGYDVKVFHWSKHEALAQVELVVKNNPILVGFSIITGDPNDIILKFCQNLKKNLPNVPIVFGGVHPTLEPRQCLKEDSVDYVILNEGEKAIVGLTDAIKNKMPVSEIEGLGYKLNNKIVITPFNKFEKNLDDFDMDWTLINVERYIWPNYSDVNRVLMGYVASRGCPHNCGFCYNQFFNKRKWRNQSSSKVIENINLLSKKYNFNGVVFFDDNFTVNKKWALEVLNGINVFGIHIETRIDYINEKFICSLVESGVKSLFLGVESGSDRVLKFISKDFTLKDTYNALNLLRKHPLNLKLSFIVGIPTETLQEYRATLKLIVWCVENLPDVGFTIGFYLPYPGTPLFDLCLKKGFKKPENFTEWKMLDRWGNQKMGIPWIEGSFLNSFEVKKLRSLLGWIVLLKNTNKRSKSLLYCIIKFRFLYSGTILIRISSYFENIFLPILKFFLKR